MEDEWLMEIYYEDPGRETLVGNIYKGRVQDVLSGMGSAFVDVGERRNLFLSAKEINDMLLRSRGFSSGRGLIPIQKILKSGQDLIVQVRREEIGSKSAQATTKISLPGRFWVFLPKEGRLGVSRRVEGRREIDRLKRIARELKQPNEGLIARTAANGTSKKDLERDFNFLLGTWKGIEEEAERVSSPQLLYRGMDLIRGTIRDRLLEDVKAVIIDDERTYHELVGFLKYMKMDHLQDQLELYQGEDLFETYGVEAQIEESLKREVPLKGGGTLVIDETEALTAIDVNSGADVRHRNQEKAILNTNLEAAVEIPRQLRLRKISGIIIVDFIDMSYREFEQRVIEKLKIELKKDRVTTDFIDMTRLGLVEITRKREGESLSEMLS
ncbi:MAG: Rne/Rng family ribonuclease [Candidatus Bipolaricaulia bacterium]